MFVYLITNTINGKRYVGQTTHSLEKRWREHKSRDGCHALYNAIKKYGSDNFIIESICEPPTVELAHEMERYYIQRYCSKSPNGYNLTDGGEGVVNPTEETRRKIAVGGYKQGAIARDSGQLASITTKETRAKGGRIQGFIQGRKNVESGQLASIRTKENQSKAAKVSGRNNVLSGHLENIRLSLYRKENHAKYLHVRWHINCNIINPNCKLCKESNERTGSTSASTTE
jgi:group I intron endonuclease